MPDDTRWMVEVTPQDRPKRTIGPLYRPDADAMAADFRKEGWRVKIVPAKNKR